MFEKLGIGHRRFTTRLKPYSGLPPWLPLIDILFLMVLFIYVSKSFVQVAGLRVELPRVKMPDTVDLEKYIVSIAPPAKPGDPEPIYYQDEMLTLAELPERLSRLHDHSKNAAIIIQADRRVAFDTVAHIMAVAERAGVPSFLAVTPATNNIETRFEQ